LKLCFREYSSLDSETKRIKLSHDILVNEPFGQPLIVVETPGFSDSNGYDNSHINKIIDEIKKFKKMDFSCLYSSQIP
jgi:hypothetical protein